MPKLRKAISVITVCIILTILTGCYDSREISDSAYIAMLGVDEGVSDRWRITFLIPFFGESRAGSGENGESGGDKGAGKYTIYTIEAPSFFEGISMANTSVSKKLIFMHANVFVFSEDIASKGKIGEFIAPLIRNREIRRTEFIIVTKGSAKSFLDAATTDIETTITKEMENLFEGSKSTGFFPMTNLNDLNNGIKSTYHQTIAAYGAVSSGLKESSTKKELSDEPNEADSYLAGDIPREGGRKIDLSGSAIINGDKMIGKLTNHETRMVLMVKNQLSRETLAISDPLKPDLIVPVDVRLSRKPDIKVKFKDDKPIIDLDLQTDGDILSIQSRIDYEHSDLTPLLEKAVEEYIKSELEKTMKKCQELRSDVFNFGDIAAIKFPTIQKWEEYNWNGHFEDAVVNINVKFKVKRTGTMISDSPIITSEGKEKDKE